MNYLHALKFEETTDVTCFIAYNSSFQVCIVLSWLDDFD